MIWRGVKDSARGWCESRSGVTDDPAMIRIVIFMGGPGDVNNAVNECEPGTLVFVPRIECNVAIARPIAVSRHRSRNQHGRIAVQFFITSGQVEGVKALEELRASIHGLADYVKNFGRQIDDRSSSNSDFGRDVPEAVAD